MTKTVPQERGAERNPRVVVGGGREEVGTTTFLGFHMSTPERRFRRRALGRIGPESQGLRVPPGRRGLVDTGDPFSSATETSVVLRRPPVPARDMYPDVQHRTFVPGPALPVCPSWSPPEFPPTPTGTGLGPVARTTGVEDPVPPGRGPTSLTPTGRLTPKYPGPRENHTHPRRGSVSGGRRGPREILFRPPALRVRQ